MNKICLYCPKNYDEIKTFFLTNEIEIDDTFDIVVVVGGDGTLLDAIKFYPKRKFILLNGGTVGYYSDYSLDNIKDFVSDFKSSKSFFEENFESIIAKTNQFELSAINEIRIESPLRTVKIDVEVDGQYLETLYGNGLIVATPFGSTGYCKSLKGAVIDSDNHCLQLIEIAPINNLKYHSLNSPLVISSNKQIKLTIEGENYFIGYDRNNIEIDGNTVIIEKNQNNVTLLHLKKNYFFERLRKTFIR